MTAALYNEYDPFAAAWLRNLIDAGEITPGIVDERSIHDLRPEDVAGFRRVHLFGGIAGWEEALRLAGWGDEPVWSGSCPCQPFSSAGKRQGESDARHLWPEMRRLVAECRPSVVFGEQVASKDGREWLARVRADLEDLGYAVGAADLCAAGQGSPHIRSRLFWVADRTFDGRPERCEDRGRGCGRIGADDDGRGPSDGGGVDRLADPEGARGRPDLGAVRGGEAPRLRGPEGEDLGRSGEQAGRLGDRGTVSGLADADDRGRGAGRQPSGLAEVHRSAAVERVPASESGTHGYWSDFATVVCRDTDDAGRHKVRRFEPGSFPLAPGLPRKLGPEFAGMDRVAVRAARANRVGRLKGYGNAICPQTAAEFVAAYMESRLDS